jgi:uncharacterized membrane protein
VAKKIKLNIFDLLKKPFFLIILITVLGGCFRFYNLDWDFQHSFHPDERNILGETSGIQSNTGYRVRFFAYGQLPVYLYRATGELISVPPFFMSICGNNGVWAKNVYWLFLALLLALLGWFLPKDKFKMASFGVAALLFNGVLLLKFFNIFSMWFNAISDLSLKGANFLFLTVVAFGISAIVAYLFEIEWLGMPFYGACGTTFILGILPFFLPDPFARTFGVLAFTLLVAIGFNWFGWVSRWGRLIMGVLAVWSLLASCSHPGPQFTGYGETMLIGRWWAAFFSTATILAVFLFVQKVYKNRGMALLASSAFAFSVVSIQVAHYCITESFITLMLVVVASLAYEVYIEGSWKNYLLVGTAFGLSMAAKTSSLYYVLIFILAHLLFLSKTGEKEWLKEDKKNKDYQGLYSILTGAILGLGLIAFIGVGLNFHNILQELFPSNPKNGTIVWILLFILLAGLGFTLFTWGVTKFKVVRAQIPYWIKLAASGGLSFVVFCLLSPWSLLDIQHFMESQGYEWHVVSIADACYVLQFKDTPRYLFHLWNLMSVELWWPLGITAVLGMIWVLAKFILRLVKPVTVGTILPTPFLPKKGFAFSLPDLILLVWFIPYFGFIGGWNTKFIRYMVPLIPVFCIFGARLLTDLFQYFDVKNIVIKALKPALITVVLCGSLFYSVAYMHVYIFHHPWIASSVWIFKNIPQGSMILKEAWDDGLPTGVDPSQDSSLDHPMGPQNYRQQDMTIYELHGFLTDDSQIKRNYYANILQQGDYISIASKKLWYTLTNCSPEFKPNGFCAYPITSRYYRLLWSGLLGYKMVGEFHNFPALFGWVHPDDMAEESFSVYDHPRVYIFKKYETVPPERILKLLDSEDYVKGINRDIMRTITPENVDAFIESRHKYLQDSGLLQKLDETEPVSQATTVLSPLTSNLPPPGNASKVKEANPQPTPEIKVIAPATVPGLPSNQTLQVLKSYADHPFIESSLNNTQPAKEDGFFYQIWAWLIWLVLLIVLGWMVLPLTLKIFLPLGSGAYSLSKVFGFFIFAWAVWFFTSVHCCKFTMGSCWFWLLLLGFISAWAYWKQWKSIKPLYTKWSKTWLIQEGVFVLAFALFSLVKIFIAHIHDPVGEGYNGGGEAGMDFGFLASVVRGETFPPQNMWMAGLPIGYTFYYGHLMMGVLTKTLGLVPAITYNLALITLFAMIFSCAFGLAYSLSGRLSSGWIAGALCALAGNPDGIKQYMDVIRQCFMAHNLSPLLQHVYDYWGPTRVIPPLSINEFPYFSVLYGDMHAHTLAMPFAMLLIGVIASIYLSMTTRAFVWKKDWAGFLTAGFLLGGIAFLNTWEIPTWLGLLGIALLVRHLSGLNGKVLHKGLTSTFGTIVIALALLGWWVTINPSWLRYLGIEMTQHALGGATPFLVGFAGLGFLAAVIWLFTQKSTRLFSEQLITIAISVLSVLAVAGFLWIPYFANFSPQQNKIMWVIPTIRTSIKDYFSVHGFFLSVLLMSFAVAFSKEIINWIGKNKKEKWGWEIFLDKFLGALKRLIVPQTAVQGMLSLGLATLAVIWGASWAHWTEPQDKMVISECFASLTAILLVVAIYFKDRLEIWAAEIVIVLLWVSVLVFQGIHLIQDKPFTLELGLFSVLWLLAFFYLGTAVKVFKDRNLSFSYIIVSFFFFITATLEIFVMSEYFGFGDGMRNNSMFKYGINAWTLASIGSGVFLPKIFDFFSNLLKTIKKESTSSRVLLVNTSGVIFFVLFRIVLDSYLPGLQVSFISIINIIFIAGFLTWNLAENRPKSVMAKGFAIGLVGILVLFSAIPLFPSASYSSGLGLFQRWCEDQNLETIFPAVLALITITATYFFWEKRKDLGRRMVYQSWVYLLTALIIAVSIYPIASTWRKCHGFFSYFQHQWGVNESPTLNGLAYISPANPADGAAIRFLNEHIPGQPCLVEFVGEGYNSWGSRFSIFTGIPALMGWNGHVGEWVGAHLGQDIQQRFDATETIFRTTDINLAKKTLDAYGVRLVMVGTVEREGVPGGGRKKGYPPEGLAKFPQFLPLIYKNPGVEIYYNPPPVSQ